MSTTKRKKKTKNLLDKWSQIGLDKKNSKKVANLLNDLLANYSIFYQNIRGCHWNVEGDKFFELHVKFEELYNDLYLKIDEIAERILTLGHHPNHKFSDYLKDSGIKESEEVSDSEIIVADTIASFQILIDKERKILDLSGQIKDEGTNALMSDYIQEKEKLVWMYTAYSK